MLNANMVHGQLGQLHVEKANVLDKCRQSERQCKERTVMAYLRVAQQNLTYRQEQRCVSTFLAMFHRLDLNLEITSVLLAKEVYTRTDGPLA